MNLWIILALTWISITVVIADHGWFVQDSPPAGEENELFSSEHLLVFKPKPKPKPKSITPGKVNKDHNANENPKKKVKEHKQKKENESDKKSTFNDVELENLIPVQSTVRKPLAVSEKIEETKRTQVKVNKLEKKSPTPHVSSSKTADHAWFIQDDSLNGEDNEDLFSSENLLVVKPKPKYKPTPAKPNKPADTVKSEKSSQVNGKAKFKKEENKPKTPPKPTKSSDINEVESEHLIPVHGTGRKPLAVVQNTAEKDKPVKKPTVPQKEFIEYDEIPCDSEKDIDCLMETEDLILVAKKKPAKPTPKIDTKPLIKRENVETMKHEEVKKPEPIKKKVEEVQRAALHRRLLDSDKSSTTQPSKPVQQPLLYELKEEDEGIEEEDLLATEKEDEDILRRLRRQATADDIGSGDQASFQETTDPVFTMQFSTTLNVTRDRPLTDEEKQAYTDEITAKLNALFNPTPGSKGVVVKDVRLDQNGRVVADWDLKLSLSAADNDPTKRKQALLVFLTNTVVPTVNNLNVFGHNVYTKLDRDITSAIATAMFEDICQATNACPNGFACIEQSTLAICQHKCYSTNLVNLCQNGGSCQLDDVYEPYCQCGTGFTGNLCQNVTSEADSTYTTTQVVGAGVGAAVAALGLVSCAIYLAIFRKRREKDMEYSYFGDDEQSATAFSDADANLGTNNYVIPRPEIGAPLDIFNA